jgi:hypothetical protein
VARRMPEKRCNRCSIVDVQDTNGQAGTYVTTDSLPLVMSWRRLWKCCECFQTNETINLISQKSANSWYVPIFTLVV